MPTYEFKCPRCDNKVDAFFNFHEKHELKCDCGAEMEKVYQANAAIFRGGGWGGQ
jgi:putative FmdB family regulatory protein